MTFPRLVIALSCALIPLSAQAEKISRVDIHGLDEAMAENVRVNLSLEDSLDKTITARRLDYLLETAFGKERGALDRAVDVCVSRLRQHLESDPRKATLLRTVRNAGYQLDCDVSTQPAA